MDESNLRAMLGKMGVRVVARSRDWLVAPCPLAPWRHRRGHDRTPSFAAKINPRGLSGFTCQACHAQGRVSGLARLIGDYSGDDMSAISVEAEMIEASAGNLPRYDDRDRPGEEVPIAAVDPGPWKERLRPFIFSNDACAYLEGRGVSRETAAQIGIMWDAQERRVVFPVYTRTALLAGFTGRAIDEGVTPKIRDYAGLPKARLVMGCHLWTRDLPVLIVEGLFAYAHMWEIGINNLANIGAILGSSVTRQKASIITEIGRSVFMFLDNDVGGDTGLWGAQQAHGGRSYGAVDRLAFHVPVYVPTWPDGKIDPDELTAVEVRVMMTDTDMYAGRR